MKIRNLKWQFILGVFAALASLLGELNTAVAAAAADAADVAADLIAMTRIPDASPSSELGRGRYELSPERVTLKVSDDDLNQLEVHVDGRLTHSFSPPFLYSRPDVEAARLRHQAALDHAKKLSLKVICNPAIGKAVIISDSVALFQVAPSQIYDQPQLLQLVREVVAENLRLREWAQKDQSR